MKTVNVVEYFSETIQAIHAFPDTKEGNAAAEKLFATVAKENGFDEEEIEQGLEDGHLDRDAQVDDYEIFLIHST